MCEASFVNIATATSALGPCTGVTVDVSQSDLDLIKGQVKNVVTGTVDV